MNANVLMTHQFIHLDLLVNWTYAMNIGVDGNIVFSPKQAILFFYKIP